MNTDDIAENSLQNPLDLLTNGGEDRHSEDLLVVLIVDRTILNVGSEVSPKTS